MKYIKNLIYKLAFNVVAKKIVNSTTRLTHEYLLSIGWISEFDEVRGKTFYVEPNIKDRDKVSVEFENHYYRVWHGENRTFVALESSVEWLQLHLFLLDKHNKVDSWNIKATQRKFSLASH